MVEYTAISIIVVGCMFYLLKVANSLERPEILKDGYADPMDWIKIFLLFMGFGVGLVGLFLSSYIAIENSASAGVKTTLAGLSYVWGALAFVFLVALALYLFVWVPWTISKMLKERKKNEW